jgi:hypothetical protein
MDNYSNLILGVLGSMAIAGVGAGASGLVEIARVDERVAANTGRIYAAEEVQDITATRQMEIQRDVEVVKERVRNIDESVRRNGDKIDQILDRLPRPDHGSDP